MKTSMPSEDPKRTNEIFRAAGLRVYCILQEELVPDKQLVFKISLMWRLDG
jgi:hypothetical protein